MPTIFALLTKDGTACAETALYGAEDTPARRATIEATYCRGPAADRFAPPVPGTWTDVSDNEALQPE